MRQDCAKQGRFEAWPIRFGGPEVDGPCGSAARSRRRLANKREFACEGNVTHGQLGERTEHPISTRQALSIDPICGNERSACEQTFGAMNDQYTQSKRPIAIETPLGPDVLLLKAFTFKDAVNEPFELELELQSTHSAIDFNAILGQSITVALDLPNGNRREINGIVSRFQQLGSRDPLTDYAATVVPWFDLLKKTTDCRTFQNITAPSIVTSLSSEFGFTGIRDDLSTPYPELLYRIQFNETAFNFLSRQMQDAGISYRFEHAEKRDIMVLFDPSARKLRLPGAETIPFIPKGHSRWTTEAIHSWTIDAVVESGSVSVNDYNYLSPKQNLLETSSVSQSYARGSFNRYSYPGNYGAPEHGELIALLRMQEAQTRQTVYRAETHNVGICVGHVFALAYHPREDQNANYLVTELTLRVETAPFDVESNSDTSLKCLCQFAAIPALQPLRPSFTASRPRIHGILTAKVTAPEGQDPGIPYTDPYARAKVLFSWDHRGPNNDSSSLWVRISQPSAGSFWGSMYLPRPGNEVLVAFEGGDPDRPTIVGRVYNADQMPALQLPNQACATYISDNGANAIVMNSTAGQQSIVLSTPYNDTYHALGYTS